MRFIKRLIILTGENKGTLAIEKNGAYINAKFTSFGKNVEACTLVMLIDGKKHIHKLRANIDSFLISCESIDTIHAAVFCSESLLMYGTNVASRLLGSQINALLPAKKAQIFENDGVLREQIKEDIFSGRKEYADDAIAQTNYYPSEFLLDDSEFVPIEEAAAKAVQQPNAQKNDLESEENEISDKGEQIMKELPSLRCINYLYSLNRAQPAFSTSFENDFESVFEPFSSKQENEPPKELRQEFKPKQTQRVEPVSKEIHINAREGNFFERCGEDIEKIFAQNPAEKQLENALPNSRWVRIEYNESGKYYVMGLIGKEYLCYGLPADFSPTPPEELNGYCWWLPLSPANPREKGYWIMYQSLKTGDPVLPNK